MPRYLLVFLVVLLVLGGARDSLAGGMVAHSGAGLAPASAGSAKPLALAPPTGVCCEPDGSCRLLTEAGCLEGGGINWMNSQVCLGTCPAVGACCLGDGTCAIMIEGACTRTNGLFDGIGPACAPGLCRVVWFGRCEYVTLYSTRILALCVTYATCAGLGGNNWVPVKACIIGSTGACCLPNGICMVEMQSECDSQGGLFQGSGSTCTAANCGLPPPFGQCCYPDGHCEFTSNTDCALSGGANWTPLKDCGLNCPAVGACCLNDGTCLMVIQDSCEENRGRYLGAQTSCSPDPCGPVPVSPRTWGSIKARYQ